MVPALLIMIREGFEAALVVAIVFAYLRRIDRLDLARAAWGGVAAAVATSVAVGAVVHVTLGNLAGANRARAFAAVSVAAAAVLTWMIFWMRRQARAIKSELEHRVDEAVRTESPRRAVVAVTFLAVVREGVEAALFLLAVATASGGGEVVLGAVLGIAVAIGLGLVVYLGGRRLPMRAFFQVTGMVVVVFAAGLLARAVLFLQVSGDLGTLADAVYDVTGITWLTQRSQVGMALAALVGWDPRPSIEQVVAWVAYFVPVTYLFLRPTPARPVGTVTLPAPVTSAGLPGEGAARADEPAAAGGQPTVSLPG